MRKTIQTPITLKGTGLHSGAVVTLRLFPGQSGMRVIRNGQSFAASWDNVRAARLCTLLVSPKEPSFTLSTTEHLMSALAALGITDVDIETDGPEVPILDGSALPFFEAILDAGTVVLPGRQQRLVITRPVVYREGLASASLFPADRFTASFSIDFAHPAIGAQTAHYDPLTTDYAAEIAPARTFCMEADVIRMRASGLALGGTLDNAVVFGETAVVSPGGLRFPDEPARHKLLDALGDLHLSGMEIVGRFEGVRSGHLMTNLLLRQAFASGAVARAA